MGGGFPLDLLLFGMIAAFLVLRLRGILGRRTGYERQSPPERPGAPVAAPDAAPAGRVVDMNGEPLPGGRPLPDPASPAGQTLLKMQSIDRAFDPANFLRGAEAAFRMIVEAFAKGDRAGLRPLLADSTYESFEKAISAREAAGETQRSEVRSIETAAIDEAATDGEMARITVRFVSDQIAETVGADGKPTAGTDAVTEITDLWTFERHLGQPDPAWRLSAARSG